MIEKAAGGFTLSCDICGEEPINIFPEFMGAVNYKKQNGWKSQRRNSEWEDACTTCRDADRG